MSSHLIPFLLILSPLITESIRLSELDIYSNDVSIVGYKSNDYKKRDLSIRAIQSSDSMIRGKEETLSNPYENTALFRDKHNSEPKVADNNNSEKDKNERQSCESKYKSLAIVWSVCAVIVLTIGLTALYIHFKKGNNSSQESLNTNGFQLNLVSNNVNLDLDLMSGTHYLNTGIMAFNDITTEILTVHQNKNAEQSPN